MRFLYRGSQDQGCVNRVETDTYKSHLVINFSMRPPINGHGYDGQRKYTIYDAIWYCQNPDASTKHPITSGHKDDLQ